MRFPKIKFLEFNIKNVLNCFLLNNRVFRMLMLTFKFSSLTDENLILRSEKSRLEQQCADSQRRERILTKRLAIKEQEYQDFVVGFHSWC